MVAPVANTAARTVIAAIVNGFLFIISRDNPFNSLSRLGDNLTHH
jgi:hypothetical protein